MNIIHSVISEYNSFYRKNGFRPQRCHITFEQIKSIKVEDANEYLGKFVVVELFGEVRLKGEKTIYGMEIVLSDTDGPHLSGVRPQEQYKHCYLSSGATSNDSHKKHRY